MATFAYFNNNEGSSNILPIPRIELPKGTLARAARVPVPVMRQIVRLADSSPRKALQLCEKELDAIAGGDIPAHNTAHPVLKQLLGATEDQCSFSSGSVLVDVVGPSGEFGRQLEDDAEIAEFLGLSCQVAARRTLESCAQVPSVDIANALRDNTLLSDPYATKLVCAHTAQPNAAPQPLPRLPHGGEPTTVVSVMQCTTTTDSVVGKALCNQFWKGYEKLQDNGGFRRGTGYLLFASHECPVRLSTAEDRSCINAALSGVMEHLGFKPAEPASDEPRDEPLTFTSLTSPGVFILMTSSDNQQHHEVLPSVQAFLRRSLPQEPRMITTAAVIAHPDLLRACISDESWGSLPQHLTPEGPIRALDAAARAHASTTTTAIELLQLIGLEENSVTHSFFETARLMDQGKGTPGQCALRLAQEAIRSLCWSEVVLDVDLAQGLQVGEEKVIQTGDELGRKDVLVRRVDKEKILDECASLASAGINTDGPPEGYLRLYHGTSVRAAACVLEYGFDVDLGSPICNFGRAVYLTDSPSYAHLYAMDRGGHGERSAVIVVDIPEELFDEVADRTLDLRAHDRLPQWRVLVRLYATAQIGKHPQRKQMVSESALIVGPVSQSVTSAQGHRPEPAQGLTQWAFRTCKHFDGVSELHRCATFSVLLC